MAIVAFLINTILLVMMRSVGGGGSGGGVILVSVPRSQRRQGQGDTFALTTRKMAGSPLTILRVRFFKDSQHSYCFFSWLEVGAGPLCVFLVSPVLTACS